LFAESSGMTIMTIRAPRDPVAVASAYTIEVEGSGGHHPQEVCPGGAPTSSRLVDAQIRERAAPQPVVSFPVSSANRYHVERNSDFNADEPRTLPPVERCARGKTRT
jgi:hypothetical protein